MLLNSERKKKSGLILTARVTHTGDGTDTIHIHGEGENADVPHVEVSVIGVKGNQVRLHISAEEHVSVDRDIVYNRKLRERNSCLET